MSNVFYIKIFLGFFGDPQLSFILCLGLGLVGPGPDYKVLYLWFSGRNTLVPDFDNASWSVSNPVLWTT